MSPAPTSQGNTGELQSLFQQFVQQLSTDSKLAEQLTAWSRAHRRWRSHWAERGVMSHDRVLALLLPNAADGEANQWVHPIVDEAPELRAWRERLDSAASARRDELSATFVRVIASIEGNPGSLADGCNELERAAGDVGLPLAALTAALGALDPNSRTVVCDAWLRTVSRYDGRPLRTGASAFPDVNSASMRVLSAAEGGRPLPPALERTPAAERFGVFCTWLARANAEPAGAARFDVTRRKYKDWPPMW